MEVLGRLGEEGGLKCWWKDSLSGFSLLNLSFSFNFLSFVTSVWL